MSASNLRTLRQLSEEFPAFTQAALRWHVFRAPENGLGEMGAIVRIGRRVLVDRVKFETWVSRHQCGGQSEAAD